MTTFDVYLTLDVPIGEKPIVEMSSIALEYKEVHAVWMKEWSIHQYTSELTCMPDFILAKKDVGGSFKRNFIIYLVNYFFSASKTAIASSFFKKM